MTNEEAIRGLDILIRDFSEIRENDTLWEAIEMAKEAIRECERLSLDPVVHGRLVEYEAFSFAPSLNGYLCSVCGMHQGIISPLNYCPNCGAKMDSEA